MQLKNVLFLIIFSIAVCPAKSKNLKSFKWKIKNKIVGTLLVPSGYKLHNNYYGEGIFTSLSYKDSSEIFLHFGGDISLPIVRDDIIVNDSVSNKCGKGRKGLLKNKNLYWREDNHPCLINIGYLDVHPEMKIEFEKSIDSFQTSVRCN